METTISGPALVADYTRWLNFVMASRETIRRYDRQLIQIGKQRADLGELSDYLRTCMHHRSQFFGHLAIQLTANVAQLRAEPTNQAFIRRMAHAQPIMQVLITQLMDAFSDIEESYQTLLPFVHPLQPSPSPPAFNGLMPHRP